MRGKILAILALTIAAVVGNADAAMLYEFSTTRSATGTYDPTLVTTTAAANVIAPNGGTELDDGVVGLDLFDNKGWDGFSLGNMNGNLSIDNEAEFATAYFELTVSADAGYTLDLDSLSLNSARGGSTGIRGFEIYAAVDGGAFTYGVSTPLVDVANETGTRTDPRPVSIDLTGAEYQGIESITFRYYALTDSPGNFVRSIDFDGWTLVGDVVPEPASLALLGIGGLTMTIRRRRKA